MIIASRCRKKNGRNSLKNLLQERNHNTFQMSKPLVVITGKQGQLGWELQQLAGTEKHHFDILFTGKEELDLTDLSAVPVFFEKHKPAYFINCAAYTAVDKAETEKE